MPFDETSELVFLKRGTVDGVGCGRCRCNDGPLWGMLRVPIEVMDISDTTLRGSDRQKRMTDCASGMEMRWLRRRAGVRDESASGG